MAGKPKDTEFKTVIVTPRNPDEDIPSIYAGGNDVVINGKRTLKHYRIKPGEPVELPVTFIEQLKRRHYVGKGKNDEMTRLPMYVVEEV